MLRVSQKLLMFYVTNTTLPGIHLWIVSCAFVNRFLCIYESFSVRFLIACCAFANCFLCIYESLHAFMDFETFHQDVETNPQISGLHPPPTQANQITATSSWPIVARSCFNQSRLALVYTGRSCSEITLLIRHSSFVQIKSVCVKAHKIATAKYVYNLDFVRITPLDCLSSQATIFISLEKSQRNSTLHLCYGNNALWTRHVIQDRTEKHHVKGVI